MPRGVKTARSANNTNKNRELVFREDGQVYGTVTKALGHKRVRVMMTIDDETAAKETTCTIRGSMRRRDWVGVGDTVLVALRDFGETHDIIHRYTPDEVSYLVRINEIVQSAAKTDVDDPADLGVEIVFEDI